MGDFFRSVGSIYNVFLICAVVAALGLAAWMTFLRGGPGDIFPGSFDKVANRLEKVSTFFGNLPVLLRKANLMPAPAKHEKRRNQRSGKKRAGGKKKRSAE